MAARSRIPVVRILAACLCAALTVLAANAIAADHPQSTLVPRSDVGWMIQHLLESIVFWVVVIFIGVEAALIVTVLRFRRRPDGPAPKQVHGNTTLEVAWTIAPAIILAFIAVPTVKTIFQTAAMPPHPGLEVKVVGHQWWWEFQYPGLGVTTANELHVPVGTTVALSVESADVIHSFWIPTFSGKRDVIPGRTNHLWFTPDSTGTFPGQCAEFCGASHANMHFKVISEPRAAFDAWVAEQKAPTPPPDSTSLAAKGQAVFQNGLCVACHTIDGVSFGQIGPNLTKVATRGTIAAGMFPNDAEHLANWIRNAPAQKPGSIMPGPPTLTLTDEQVRALVAYLQSRR